MSNFNRRNFFGSTSAIAAGTAFGFFSERDVIASQSPNSRPTFALIGCGGQGTGDGRRALNHGDVVAVCDVDSAHSSYAKAAYTRRMSQAGKQVSINVYDDYRAVIDRDDIDAIICGTVDHWHVKIAAEALRSGKDVYCEKPLTLTVDEGKII